MHPCTTSREVVLRYRGLAFARWDDGAIFWLQRYARRTDSCYPEAFERMMQDLEVRRIRSHPLRAILYIARKRNAGLSVWCGMTSRGWMAFWILALSMLKCLRAAARSTAS